MSVSEEDEEIGLDASQNDEKYLHGTSLVKKTGSIFEEEIELDSDTIMHSNRQSRIFVNDSVTFDEDDLQ